MRAWSCQNIILAFYIAFLNEKRKEFCVFKIYSIIRLYSSVQLFHYRNESIERHLIQYTHLEGAVGVVEAAAIGLVEEV